MRRVVLKSPVLENCTPGSVRGALGNQRPYLDNMPAFELSLIVLPPSFCLHFSATLFSVCAVSCSKSALSA